MAFDSSKHPRYGTLSFDQTGYSIANMPKNKGILGFFNCPQYFVRLALSGGKVSYPPACCVLLVYILFLFGFIEENCGWTIDFLKAHRIL